MLDVSATTSMNTGPHYLSQSIASYFLIVTIVVLVTRVWLSQTTRKLVKPNGHGAKPLPGPRGIPIFGNMLSLGRTSPQITMMNLAKQFGSIFQLRLGSRPVLVLNGYDAIHKALVKQSVVFAGRPKLFTFELLEKASPSKTSMSFGTYGDHWKLHRKLAESSLRHFTAGSQVKFVESVVSTEATELALHIKNEMCENNNNGGKEFEPSPKIKDLRNFIRLAVSNVICWFMFSKRHTYEDKDLLYLLSISDRFSAAAGAGNPVDFMPWLRLFMKKTTKEFTGLLNDFQAYVGGKVDQHQRQYKDGSERDILDHLVTVGRRNKEDMEQAGLTESMLLGTCIDYFGAGFETVAATLEWCFLYMAAYPDVQREIQRELESVVGCDRLPTLDDRDSLPITQSCLLEIQRHASTVPISIPHSTIDDTVLEGFFVPRDTVVFANLYSAHYDQTIWQKPEVFDAHRFLSPDGSIDAEKKKHVIPFSVGRRRCVGSDLARIELFLFFSIFLQRFTFESLKGEVSFEGVDGLARRVKDLDIRLIPRD